MKKQFGFTLIEVLVVLAVLIITLAGGVVVWEKKTRLIPFPTPVFTPPPTPTLQDLLIPTVNPTWTQICKSENDCPKQFCQPPDKPCTQYYCIQGKCQLIEPSVSSSCQTDADCPSIACVQGCPVEPCPPCPKNKCVNAKCQTAYPSYSESEEKKIQLSPGQTVNIKNTNLSLTLLSINPPPENSFDSPTGIELEVRSEGKKETIKFSISGMATQEIMAKMRVKEVFGFKITLEELRPEWITVNVQKL